MADHNHVEDSYSLEINPDQLAAVESIVQQSVVDDDIKADQGAKRLQQVLDPAYLPTVSMDELYEQAFWGNPPVIEGLLNPGVYIFAGSPKIGKSFLAAQLSYHVSTGRSLWDYSVRQGDVLYLALEDNFRRLQERLYRMYGTEAVPNLRFSVSAKQLGNGLEDQLQKYVREYPNTRLVVIDTLQKIREGGAEKYSYASDYDAITQVKSLADRNGICIVLVHHTRKQQADDKMEMISGTTGLLGAADGALVMHKAKRTDNTAILEISGRDQQDQRLYLRRDEDRLIWELERRETNLWQEPPDPVLEAVAAIVTEERPVWKGTATDLVAALGLGLEIKANALARILNIRASKLCNNYNIAYASARHHSGRSITLTRVRPDPPDSRDGRDDRDDAPQSV